MFSDTYRQSCDYRSRDPRGNFRLIGPAFLHQYVSDNKAERVSSHLNCPKRTGSDTKSEKWRHEHRVGDKLAAK